MERCPNMNHSRSNIPIRYCPDCGEKLSSVNAERCIEAKHVSRRKNRNRFCCDCGIKLFEGR